MPADPPAPGTIEYAAAAKEAFAARFARMKAAMPGGEDLVTIIYGIAYDNEEGFCLDYEGEPDAVLRMMAMCLLYLAEQRYEKVQEKEKFLPDANKTPFKKVAALLSKQLILTIGAFTHDDTAGAPSGIVLPDSP